MSGGCAVTRQAAAQRARQGELRLDIQGVRGLGVSLVVVGHLFLWPAGVFAALDIFFTLSGFLITAILVPSIERYGVGFFGAFYLSRARRLVPMATLVLVFTVVATTSIYSEARALLVGEDAVWAFFFAVNWHFIEQGNDYFALHTASPLQHYWSLSVEEQFYLVWPLLVLIAVTLAARLARARRAPRSRWVAGDRHGTATFAYSLWHSATQPGGGVLLDLRPGLGVRGRWPARALGAQADGHPEVAQDRAELVRRRRHPGHDLLPRHRAAVPGAVRAAPRRHDRRPSSSAAWTARAPASSSSCTTR